jgi:hypothetical protein
MAAYEKFLPWLGNDEYGEKVVEQLAGPYEGPHDSDVHSGGAFAAEHAGKHGNALFRENQGNLRRPPRPLFDVTICDIKASNSSGVS